MDIVSIARFLLFCASTGGLVFYVCNFLTVKLVFAPAIIFSGIICVLLLAGYLNVLPYAAYAICLLGIIFSYNTSLKRESS